MRPVDRLVLYRGVPPAIKQEDVVGELQVEPDAAGAVAHQDDMPVRIGFEAIKDRLSLRMRDAAVIQQRAVRLQRLRQHLQRLHPLREDDRLAIAVGNFFQVGKQLLQLGAGAGQRVEVTDLLEAQHQLKDVLHRDGVIQRIEADDAVALGKVVGLALSGGQLEVAVAIDARRHVGGRLLLGAAQDAVGGQVGQTLYGSLGRNAVRIDKGKDVD